MERHLRAAVRAMSMGDEDPRAMPLMSHEAYVESCGLVAGVPEQVLVMLELFYTGNAGTKWEQVLVEIQGEDIEVRDEQVAEPLKLSEAARMAGLGDMDHRAARGLQLMAIEVVTTNLVRRASREEKP